MKKYLIVIILLLICATPVISGGTFGPQSSDKNTEWGFDFVETFDGIKDWRGNCTGGNIRTNLPLHENDDVSNWDWYDEYDTSCDTGENWIDEYAAENLWGGTGKSLRIDLDDANPDGQQGAQRLGLYFGDGNSDSGYSSVFIFHMVKIEDNQWPTTIDGSDVGSWVDGTPYTYLLSWKFGNINIGMTGPREHPDLVSETYSPFHIIPHIKSSSGTGNYPSVIMEPNDDGDRTVFQNTIKPVTDYNEEWFGVEFNYIRSGTTVTLSVWIYDSAGNATLVHDAESVTITGYSGDLWNGFFFGGNNSAAYSWGRPSMDSPYYIDDLIINDSRIGPTYFSLLSAPVSVGTGGGTGSKY